MIDSELVEWGDLTAATLGREVAGDDVSVQERRVIFFGDRVRDSVTLLMLPVSDF